MQVKKIRRCRKNSGYNRNTVIRIKESVRMDLQYIKEVVGLNPSVGDGEVVENLVNMFKRKKIGSSTAGKGFNAPLETESLDDFYKDKEIEETIKSYEYLLDLKQQTLDNYIQYLNTACELGRVNKVQIMDIVNKKTAKPTTTTTTIQ